MINKSYISIRMSNIIFITIINITHIPLITLHHPTFYIPSPQNELHLITLLYPTQLHINPNNHKSKYTMPNGDKREISTFNI